MTCSSIESGKKNNRKRPMFDRTKARKRLDIPEEIHSQASRYLRAQNALNELRKQYKKGLITKEEYIERRKEII